MSSGGVIGGIVGGVVGFAIGGPPGAVVGFGIGFGLGMLVDPITPDIPSPGSQDLQVTTNTIGSSIPDLVGTGKLSGNLLCYGGERVKKIKEKPEGGKGGDGEAQVVGYKYYASWALGISIGEVDALLTVFRNDDVVWDGILSCPESGGVEEVILTGMGKMYFYFGTDDQAANLKVGTLLDDDTLNSPNRGLCWAFFDDCYIGDYNRIPTMKFVIRKIPSSPFATENKIIRTFDYNPAHAIWYILCVLTGLPESWLHTSDFETVASTLSSEFRGMSIIFAHQNNTLTYLEMINKHVDGIIRYGSDGKFHPKLIRDDYDVGSLPLIDENILTAPPAVSRRSWIDTINEVKVQYTEQIEVVTDSETLIIWSPTNPTIMQHGDTKVVEFYGNAGIYITSEDGTTEYFEPFDFYLDGHPNYYDEFEGWMEGGTSGLNNNQKLITTNTGDTLAGYVIPTLAIEPPPHSTGESIFASNDRQAFTNDEYWRLGQGLDAVYVLNEYTGEEELLFLHCTLMYNYDSELYSIRAFLSTNRSLEVVTGEEIFGELQPLACVINLGSISGSGMYFPQCIKKIGNDIWFLYLDDGKFCGFKLPWFPDTEDWDIEYPVTPVDVLANPLSLPFSWGVEERNDGEIFVGLLSGVNWDLPPIDPHYIWHYDKAVGDLTSVLDTGGVSCGHAFDEDGNLWACDYAWEGPTVGSCRVGMWLKADVDSGVLLTWGDAEEIIDLGTVEMDSGTYNWGANDIEYRSGKELYVSMNAYSTWNYKNTVGAVARIYYDENLGRYLSEIIHQEINTHDNSWNWYSTLSYDSIAGKLYVEIAGTFGMSGKKDIIEIEI